MINIIHKAIIDFDNITEEIFYTDEQLNYLDIGGYVGMKLIKVEDNILYFEDGD